MPSILSRFKRSPSNASDSTGENRQRRSSTVSNTLTASSDDETVVSPVTSRSPSGGSRFVEDLGESPTKKHRPAPLAIPEAVQKPLGTPKLVLTEEGSNSPRSFESSPVVKGREGVGLGIATSEGEPLQRAVSEEDGLITPHADTTFDLPPAMPAAMLGAAVPFERERAGSVTSRRTEPIHLDVSVAREKKKKKKNRTMSTSSAMSGASSSIAKALAKSGLHIASPTNGDSTMSSQQSTHSKRSPFLARGDEAVEDDLSDDEDDDTESDGDDHLPVTGFAVASNKRQADFHAQFPAVDEGDYLIEDYGAALSKDILVQGRLFVSENHICFHANIFGWVTDVVVAFTDIRTIEKKMTALVIPNAICISTASAKYTFASLLARDATYDVMMNVWRLCNPNAVMSTTSLHQTGSRPASIVDEPAGKTEAGGGHAKTQCTCGKEGKHYSEMALDATFPSTPEKIYNLMFTSDWFKTFLSDTEKLKDVEMSDWKPDENKHLSRSTSYIKPLNGSIGPKQTKCHIVDEQEHGDFDDFVSMLTTTRTPDVPSGGVFSVKTRTCLTWAGANSTRVIVTTTVEWTGKSWVKGIIEKSAIEGQKTYHDDLEAGIRAYIKEHATEFVGEGSVIDEPEPEKTDQPTEAEAYAAQQRKEREDRDKTYLQWGLDLVVSGFGMIGTGLKTAGEALNDMPGGKEAILGSVIALLVISNIYTYSRKTDEGATLRRAKRLGRRGGMAEDEVAEALKMVLQGKANAAVVPREEAGELRKILDEVELRATRLREMIDSAVGGEGSD